MKEMKDGINRWRDIPCSWVGRINILKMNILPNTIYRFSAVPIKLPVAFFTELEWKNYRIHMGTQKTPNSQRSLEKEEWSWRNQPSWLQIILYSYTHQDSMVLAQKQKYRPIKQDSPEINPYTYGYLIFDKGGKNIQWSKDSLFNKWCWEKWTTTCKRMKLEDVLTPYTKINLKWIKDLNIRPVTIKLLEENIEHSMTEIKRRSSLIHLTE